jgi:Mor family transcriptional regulator
MQITDDLPTIVADEIAAAHQAGIPPADQPEYIKDRLRHRLSGDVGYIRKRDLSPHARRDAIRRRFNGKNMRDLALEFGLTVRRVRQILRDA